MNTRGLILAAALGSTGCASIMNTGTQKLAVESPVPNAEISIKSFKGDEIYNGPSPANIRVRRSDQYTVLVSAPGYVSKRQVVWQEMSGWAVGNLVWIIPIFWGLGLAVDAMTGGIWTLYPDQIHLDLRRLPEQPSPTSATPPITPTAPKPTEGENPYL